MTKIHITLDGSTHEIAMKEQNATILEEALDAGLDAPYSCQGGVCTTCKCKITEGNVSMDTNFALTDTEVAQGYILACQARPTTEKIAIDFDNL